jgi:hypothetical protein
MDTEIMETLMELDIPDNLIEIVLNVYELVMSDQEDETIRINVYENSGVQTRDEFVTLITGSKPRENVEKAMGKMKLLKLAGINFNDESGLLVIDKVKAKKRLSMLKGMMSKGEE